ncbi:MAG: hypothetical protein OJF50_000662 [Nitrospira sp.]|nr:hypothetical protein [Nitrospira sp.]
MRALELDLLGESLIESDYLHRLNEEPAKTHENGKKWLKDESLKFVS